MQGRVCEVESVGNPFCHVVLRGGADGPNYQIDVIQELSAALKKEGIRTGIMVDASHVR
jgi:3-deoxy-7-phosphoheptulonate synthase